MKKLISFVLFLFLWTFSCINAAEVKVAVANMETLFQKYEKTKVTEMRFNQQLNIAKDYAKKIYSDAQRLQRECEQLQLELQSVSISDAQKVNLESNYSEKRQLLQAKQRELANFNSTRKQQITSEYEALCKDLVNEIKNSVARKAVLEGYQIVLDSSSANNGLLFYSSDITDITLKVLEDLNKNYRKNSVNQNQTQKDSSKQDEKKGK